MENQHLDELIEKYILKTATIQEQQELLDWYNTQNDVETAWLSGQLKEEVLVKKRLLLNINKRIQPKSIKLWPRVAAAAAILLVAGAGVFFYTNTLRHPDAGQDPAIVNQNDIAPGHSGATLTLANGKKIRLSDASQGELAKEGGVVISKSGDGQVVYEILKQVQDDESANKTNTLTTAKGETFQVKLPDGTSVWLNAASTLTYPASFASLKQRNVELSGEGYFEVAKDKTKPFIVKTNKQEVQVLGTHFNINSYADEPNTKTTLLEGSVRVAYAPRHPEHSRHPEFISGSRTGETTLQDRDPDPQPVLNSFQYQDDGIVLAPNQQAVLANNRIKVTTVEANDAIAWKNGYFMFNTETLEEVMNKVARWYDVNVQYQSPDVKKVKFSGTMSRYNNISQILKKIASISNVTYSISGKTVFLK
ncbi:FecR family protein [Pedobacter steynii]